MNNYPLLDAFLTMLWFFLFVLWLFVLFRVILDIFRDDAMSGWAKAGWLTFTILLPYLGVLVYLIVRGHGMGERAEAEARANKEAEDDHQRRGRSAPRTRAHTACGPTEELLRRPACRVRTSERPNVRVSERQRTGKPGKEQDGTLPLVTGDESLVRDTEVPVDGLRSESCVPTSAYSALYDVVSRLTYCRVRPVMCDVS
jgi:hypothetical protein